MKRVHVAVVMVCVLSASTVFAQAPAPANPLWHEQKVRNYLPHMTSPEVADLLTRTDMVILPVASLEQHGLHGPLGTDFLNGLERAKLIAQKTDVLVAPILFPGNSPYHMAFPGTITLPAETIQLVYFQAAQSLLAHGFKRFLIMNSHGGNASIVQYVVDRINQETAGIAVELDAAAQPFVKRATRPGAPAFDRHGGVSETSRSLYLTPNLVNMGVARTAPLTLRPHLEKILPEVVAGDPTATRVFLAEALKAAATGKGTSAKDMTETGVWSALDVKTATAERGREETEASVNAAVAFIERWKQLRPLGTR
ncbi:MAG: creatininase family protein [Acidobacteriota bacterium]|nr:creatininase family protein [Acidobacteriota bacterium]